MIHLKLQSELARHSPMSYFDLIQSWYSTVFYTLKSIALSRNP